LSFDWQKNDASRHSGGLGLASLAGHDVALGAGTVIALSKKVAITARPQRRWPQCDRHQRRLFQIRADFLVPQLWRQCSAVALQPSLHPDVFPETGHLTLLARRLRCTSQTKGRD
jgi:hypothetical protein